MERGVGILERTYDAVVIGSGMGGLAAACNLAKNGFKTVLLEQHNFPGGVTTSFKRGRFEFEISVQCITEYGSKENKGPIYQFLVDDLGIDIDFPRMTEGRFVAWTDSREQMVVPLEKEELIRFIEQRVPGSEPSLRAYLDFCDEMLAAINYINDNDAAIKPVELILKHKGIVAAAGLTTKEVTDRFHIPKKALEYLDVYWTFIGPLEGRGLRWGLVAEELYEMGVRAIWINSIMNALLGLIVAMLSAAQLRTVGLDIYVADLTVIAFARELAAVMTAVVVSARTGAAIAAELATMKVQEEIDALRGMGLKVPQFLVAPKVLALLVAMPCLTVIAMYMGVLGGAGWGLGVRGFSGAVWFRHRH